MRVRLAYGRSGLDVGLEEAATTVVEPVHRPPVADPAAVRIVNHDARDPGSLVWLGRHGAGVPVWLNRAWVEADVRITTASSSRTSSPGSRAGPSWSPSR